MTPHNRTTQPAVRRRPSATAAFVRKEFRHILRDRRTMLILLGMPVVQIILFGFAISTEMRNLNVAILAPGAGEITRRITERIDASPWFHVTGHLTSTAAIDRAFRSGAADLAVAFSPRFDADLSAATGEAQIQLITDATDTNTAAAAAAAITGIIQSVLAEHTPATAPARGIRPLVRMLYNPQMKSSYTFVPGVMGLIMILICAMMTSISIVREKESGTMEVLLVSPVRPFSIILAKMVPYFVLSCVSFLLLLLLSIFLLGIPMQGSIAGLCAVSLLYILVSLSLGLLISTLVDTQIAAMLVSGMVLMVPVIFLSGMIFPAESMPAALRWLTRIVPARWYIIAVKKLMIEGLPVTSIVTELTVLLATAILLIGISLRNFKTRLE
jgi:ABC-2 type transport system permease protein